MTEHVQEIITFIICGFAALAVGRRLWKQVAAIVVAKNSGSADSEAATCSGCDSCGLKKAAPVAKHQYIKLDGIAVRNSRHDVGS